MCCQNLPSCLFVFLFSVFFSQLQNLFITGFILRKMEDVAESPSFKLNLLSLFLLFDINRVNNQQKKHLPFRHDEIIITGYRHIGKTKEV